MEVIGPDLRKRRLGRTGLMIAETGFGGAHVAASPDGEDALLTAFHMGVDFVETGRVYRGSEFLIGHVLRQLDGDASGVRIASKTLAATRDGALNDLRRSLQHLQRAAIDVYQLCSVGDNDWERVTGAGGALEGLQEARDEGLIRFIGISSHSLGVLWKAVRSGLFDTIQVKYSAFDSRSARLIRSAYHRDIGVIGMKPFGGFGMIGSLKGSHYAPLLDAPTLLAYALSNQNLSVTIPGMRSAQEVRENLPAAPLSQARRLLVRRLARRFLESERLSSPPPGSL